MIWPTTFPPPYPDYIGRMRHWATRCLAATENLLVLVCRHGECEVRGALAGVRTLPRAVNEVGQRGAARGLILRAEICRARLDELRHWCGRAARRARSEAVGALDWLLCEARAWSRMISKRMAAKNANSERKGTEA